MFPRAAISSGVVTKISLKTRRSRSEIGAFLTNGQQPATSVYICARRTTLPLALVWYSYCLPSTSKMIL